MHFSPLRFTGRPRTVLSCSIAAALLAWFPAISQAQDNTAQDRQTGTADTGLEAITVTGNWLDQPNQEKVLEHPGARTIVDRKRIEESGASNIRDVLRLVPGVQVQDSNGTGGSDVSLNLGVRGLTSRLSPRSYVLLDGVPVSYAPYGQPQLSLAPLQLGNLESVDVIRGAGSVRYGPQNVGGIINFVTRAIPEKFAAQASVNTEYYSQSDHFKTSPSAFIGGTNDAGLGVALLYSGTHGEGWRKSNDSSDIDDVMLKSQYKITAQDTVALNLHHFEGKGRMPGGLTTAQYAADPFQSTRTYDEFTGRRTDTSFKYTHKDGRNSAELLAYYVESFRGSYIEREEAGGQRSLYAAPRNYHYYGIEPRYSRLFETGPLVQEVSVGYRYLKESSSETALKTGKYTPGQVDPMQLPMNAYQTSRGGTTANAFYIDDRLDIGNWTLTPGVRYERIRSFDDVTDISNGVGTLRSPNAEADAWLPTLSLLYRLTPQWSLFANAGKSFGPQQYGQMSSTLEGLHPESAKTYEVGTHFNGDAWRGEFSLYQISFDKELFLARGDGGIAIWTDLGATRHRGVESSLSYDFGHDYQALKGLSAGATYSYTQALSQAGDFAGRDLPLYSRHTGQLFARYEHQQWTYAGDISFQSKQRSPGNGPAYITQETADGEYGDIPGFATLNARIGYTFDKSLHNARIAVGIKNLLDHRYFTRSTDNNGGKFVGQPRTIYIQGNFPI